MFEKIKKYTESCIVAPSASNAGINGFRKMRFQKIYVCVCAHMHPPPPPPPSPPHGRTYPTTTTTTTNKAETAFVRMLSIVAPAVWGPRKSIPHRSDPRPQRGAVPPAPSPGTRVGLAPPRTLPGPPPGALSDRSRPPPVDRNGEHTSIFAGFCSLEALRT